MITIDIKDLPNQIGTDLGRSPERQVTQQQVDTFADATDDHQWIHVYPERAKGGPFGRTIAHGYLSLSLVPAMIDQCLDVTGGGMRLNYGIGKVRFPSPVPVGERISLGARVADVKTVEGGYQVTIGFEVAVSGASKPSAVGEVLYNYYL